MIHAACCLRKVMQLHVGRCMFSLHPSCISLRLDSDWEKHLQAAESEYKLIQAEINHYRQVYDNVCREIQGLSVSH